MRSQIRILGASGGGTSAGGMATFRPPGQSKRSSKALRIPQIGVMGYLLHSGSPKILWLLAARARQPCPGAAPAVRAGRRRPGAHARGGVLRVRAVGRRVIDL